DAAARPAVRARRRGATAEGGEASSVRERGAVSLGVQGRPEDRLLAFCHAPTAVATAGRVRGAGIEDPQRARGVGGSDGLMDGLGHRISSQFGPAAGLPAETLAACGSDTCRSRALSIPYR